MFLSPRLSNKQLSDLCHRLGTSLAAGIDLRRAWLREVEAATGPRRDKLSAVLDEIQEGQPLAESLEKAGDLFPRLFREMVGVGERTGQTSEVLARLSNHYQVRHDLNRTFWGLMAWPIGQLCLALLAVGVMIAIVGAIGGTDLNGEPLDVLGFGLVGSSGLMIYCAVVGLFFAVAIGLFVAAKRGALWIAPLQRWATGLPGFGDAIQKICLAQISWTLHLLLNVEMDLRQMVPLVLRSSGNDYYIQHTKAAVADVALGQPLSMALANTGAFPARFLDALSVAEESGEISQSMARLSKQYEQESQTAMRWLAGALGVLFWLAVGALIVFMIFRVFTQVYLKPIQDAIDMQP